MIAPGDLVNAPHVEAAVRVLIQPQDALDLERGRLAARGLAATVMEPEAPRHRRGVRGSSPRRSAACQGAAERALGADRSCAPYKAPRLALTRRESGRYVSARAVAGMSCTIAESVRARLGAVDETRSAEVKGKQLFRDACRLRRCLNLVEGGLSQ